MKDIVLQIQDLHVSIAGKEVVSGVTLALRRSEVMVLLGQNGSGKTSLIMAIMGFPAYEVTRGDILFEGKSILGLSIDQRAQLGLGILFQRPPTVRGVKLRQIIGMAAGKNDFDLAGAAADLALTEFLDRDVNFGFSGGEMKRSELLQVMAQDPKVVLFDEPESGVDLENIATMGTIIDNFLKKKGRSALIITHTGYILDYIKADLGCVLADKRLHCIQDPKKIIGDIRKYGYEKCVKCKK